MKGLLAGLGVVSVPTAGFSAPTFEEASNENTAEAYTAFILGGGDVDQVDEAFCRLSGIDSSAADQTAQSYTGDTGMGVGFETCATTGSARLFII
ncbi:hypothetical protein [Paragemmobacter straminiformis]|uniref:Uncharacterized protein n=1 Tax=Paragemmobacter straminiformis TaxID=2045119 RepID=A0A842IA06_9RHOB|nr:hypothetical protein [Gemmobacter straminiformis]MBC2835934.1 hypothetical protein [Gemmobacter straminiformis]